MKAELRRPPVGHHGDWWGTRSPTISAALSGGPLPSAAVYVYGYNYGCPVYSLAPVVDSLGALLVLLTGH